MARQPAQHCWNPIFLEFRWPASQPNTAGIQSFWDSGGQPAHPMLWEFNKYEILEASPPTRHCRNSANFKSWWPVSQPSTAGIQQIVNSHGQSDNPTLLEFNKFEIPVASQPAQHCSNSIHYKFWWPVSERNAEPEDMCERNAEPDEMCERNAEPEEMCERNAEPEETRAPHIKLQVIS